jgi:hypothetical protein
MDIKLLRSRALRNRLALVAAVTLAWGCSGEAQTPDGDLETVGSLELTETVDPVAVTPGAGGSVGTVVVSPGSSIASAVDRAPDGARIVIQAGVYHEQVDITKPLTLEGEPGAIIEGDCVRDYGINVAQRRDPETGRPTTRPYDVTIRGLTVRNVRFSTIWIFHDEDLPQTSAPRNITVDGNTITDFNCTNIPDSSEKYRAGIGVLYSGSNIRVTNNLIKFRAALAEDAPGQRSYSNGIWFASRTRNASGGGHYIAYNRIVGGYDGIGGEVEEDPNGSFDQDTTIEFNTIVNGNDDGIQVEGGGENVIVRNNDIALYGTGIALASPHSGPLRIENNVIHHPRRGVQGNLFCFKVGRADGSGEAPLSTATSVLTGNVCTADGADAMDGVKQTDLTLAPIVFRDNCLQVSRYIYEITYGPTTGLEFDGNTFSTTDPERFIKWGSNTTLYRSLEAFQQATGQEASGQVGQTC